MHVKPATTYKEQVNRIISHGFIVNDEQKLIDFLKTANYYRFSAYFLPFKRYKHNTINISRIIELYRFDSELRAWLFEIIEHIEFYTRTQLAYYLAHKYGSLSYINADIFDKRHNHKKFLEKIEKAILDNRRTLVVQHHKNNYNGNFPIWVIIEMFSTGMLSIMYADLKISDRKEIAKTSFNIREKQLSSWLKNLTDLRNKCAHYTRFYFWNFSSIPQSISKNKQLDRTLFSQVQMLSILCANDNLWNHYYMPKLSRLIASYENSIKLKDIGFPDNWKEILSK